MPTFNALRFEPPPVPPFGFDIERRRSTTSTLSANAAVESLGVSLRGLTTSPSQRSKNNHSRPKSAKFSSYRLRSNSGLSLHTNDDILRQYTDYHPDGTPRGSLYAGGDRLRSIDSITTSSQRSSIAFTDSDTSADLPIADFVGRDIFDLVMKDPAASDQLWKFAVARGVGQNVNYLMKIRDYIQSLDQVVTQLSIISTTHTSITATSPLNLPSSMSKSLNSNIRHLTTSFIPSLENMFLESKDYIEQRIIREIFPAFVKSQLSLCTSLALDTGVEGHLSPSPFPGLKTSFCLSDASKAGNTLMYASDGFEALTGYSRGEVLGRNCRFLQGPQSDRESVARLRSAVWRNEESTELILNFRRNGQPFWNLLYMCPLLDATGKLRFYMGAQVEVSSSIESSDDVLKMLSYGSTEEVKVAENDDETVADQPELDEISEFKLDQPPKAAKKGFFRSFRKIPPPPLSPPLSPRRAVDRPRSSTGVALEKTYSTRTVLKRSPTLDEAITTPYSRYMVLEHVPSYPASLGSMPLDQESKYPPKLAISFFSQAMVEALDLGMAADAIMNKDVFDVLAEQATLPNVTKAFKSAVREVVVRDGQSVSLDLAFSNHIPRRANVQKPPSSDSNDAVREKKPGRMMSHWSPLKDAAGNVKFVMLVLSPI